MKKRKGGVKTKRKSKKKVTYKNFKPNHAILLPDDIFYNGKRIKNDIFIVD